MSKIVRMSDGLFKNSEFISDILVYLHHENFLTFLSMGQFSDIFSKQIKIEIIRKISDIFTCDLRKGQTMVWSKWTVLGDETYDEMRQFGPRQAEQTIKHQSGRSKS